MCLRHRVSRRDTYTAKREEERQRRHKHHTRRKINKHTRVHTHTHRHTREKKREGKQEESTLSIERAYIQMIEAKRQVGDVLFVCVCVSFFSLSPFRSHTRTQNEKMMKGVGVSL